MTRQPRESRAGAIETSARSVRAEVKVTTTAVALRIPDRITATAVHGACDHAEVTQAANRIVSIPWNVDIARGQSPQVTVVATTPAADIEIAGNMPQWGEPRLRRIGRQPPTGARDDTGRRRCDVSAPA